jgi:hypothetical protein
MPVQRYRSVEEMPPPWKAADAPSNLRAVAVMLELYRRLRPREAAVRGTVRRYRSVSEASAADSDPYRQGSRPC